MTSFWFTILPFVFIVSLVLVLLKIMKRIGRTIKIRWTPKHVYLVVGGYVTLGLVAFLYLQFFYESEVTIVSIEELSAIEAETTHVKQYYDENDASFLTEDYKKESWQFDFEGDVLPIDVNKGNNGFNSDLRVRYSDDIEPGRVLLSYYQFPLIIEGIDVADEVPPPHVYMNDKQLMINQPMEHTVKYNTVQAKFKILDFNQELGNSGATEIISSPYSSVLLIEVAPSTKVEDLQRVLFKIN